MDERESKLHSNAAIKQRIRDRYRGVSEDVLDVIPATPQEDFYRSEVHKRVAVYARVSTDDPNQTSSYELQKNHYEDLVNSRANWDLVGIYADEGISGTSLQHRDSFVQMIEDCQAGKIDLIVTKSVSRFARNIIDCIGYVRQLKAQVPPIGVFFETENIFTLDENSEMSLSFIATLAQEESHTKSEIMNASIEMRFKRGIFLTPVLLGYDHDEDGNLVINEDEAKTVRLIFFSYLYGYSAQQIADALTELERYTKKGNQNWSASTVLQVLSNERYCGDILARKTFTPNYLNHKSKKNNHDRNQYIQKNHHAAIISREDFFAVQKMIRNARYGNKGYFPEMHVMTSGLLRGFVTIHPKWAGFSEEDYYLACGSLDGNPVLLPSKPLEIKLKRGSFDLSGYELVRSQFITVNKRPSLTVTPSSLLFNRVSILQNFGAENIEILVHPYQKVLAVRTVSVNTHNTLKWCKRKDGEIVTKTIPGSAFLPTLYRLFGWKAGCKYKLMGTVQRRNQDVILLFDTTDAILLLDEYELPSPHSSIQNDVPSVRKHRKIKAYPQKWNTSFGEKYYRVIAQSEEDQSAWENTQTSDSGSIYMTDTPTVTTQSKAAAKITSILSEIGVTDD